MMNDIGHGHVVPRSDGVKARCGGPAMCGDCAKELARLQAAGELQAEVARIRDKTSSTCGERPRPPLPELSREEVGVLLDRPPGKVWIDGWRVHGPHRQSSHGMVLVNDSSGVATFCVVQYIRPGVRGTVQAIVGGARYVVARQVEVFEPESAALEEVVVHG
jgi:hypothetical protein